MTKEELEKVVQGAEYDFLRENPHLGSNIMFLTLGGSHAYGTNVPGSDVDVRGVTGDSKYDLLGFGTFEQVVEQSTDTTIYGFRKLVSLLINCNPNVIEMLGSKPDNYLMVSPEGQMLLDNKALFLSKKWCKRIPSLEQQEEHKLLRSGKGQCHPHLAERRS